MTTPLVDSEGFPRADLDVYAIRSARARIIQLRNDLKYTMDEIEKALQKVYDPSFAPPTPPPAPPAPPNSTVTEERLSPFAKVDGVAPGSPAVQAGLRREDLIIKFGDLTAASFSASSLQPLAELVGRNENRELRVQVLRDGQELSLQFTPRSGWGGRGLLG
ncbi:26S proteasome non-ATPase regulatory subunit 9 [Tylopilus felleus]